MNLYKVANGATRVCARRTVVPQIKFNVVPSRSNSIFRPIQSSVHGKSKIVSSKFSKDHTSKTCSTSTSVEWNDLSQLKVLYLSLTVLQKVTNLEGQSIQLSSLWQDRRILLVFVRHFG